MNALSKALITVIVVLISIRYMVFKLDLVETVTNKTTYESTIKAASQVATMKMIDLRSINKLYDEDTEYQDIPVNFDARDDFIETLQRIFKVQMNASLKGISRIDIPMVAFVSYDYIVGVTSKKTFLPPLCYTCKTNSNEIVRFTLGNKIYVNDVEKDISEINISDLQDTAGFDTVAQFKNFVILSKINEYMNTYAGTSINETASNLRTSVSFDLGKISHTSKGNYRGNKTTVIDGPGMVAVIDLFRGGSVQNKEQFERVVSFGGSELSQN